MQRVKAFELRNGGRSAVALVRGHLIDMHTYRTMGELDEMIHRTTIICPDDFDLKRLCLVDTVYKARLTMNDKKTIWTPFFIRARDLIEEIDKTSCASYRIYDTPFFSEEDEEEGQYNPVDPVALRKIGVTTEVRSAQNNGDYYVIINTDPSYYGRCHVESGKVFFVAQDRWEGPLEEGMADVKIVSEGKGGNYVSGHMTRYTDCELDEVLSYMLEQYPKRFKDYTVVRVESPTHGNYYAYLGNMIYEPKRLRKNDKGEIEEVWMSTTENADLRKHTVWSHSPIEIKFLNYFGVPLDESRSFDDIFGEKYHECWYVTNACRFNLDWHKLNGCPEDCPESLINAYRDDLVWFAYYDQYIYAAIVNKNDLDRLMDYSVDEILEILNDASEINHKAEEAIKSRISKGKIRLAI